MSVPVRARFLRAATTALLLAPLIGAACGDRADPGSGPYARQVAEAIPRIERVTGLRFKTRPTVDIRSRQDVRAFLERRFQEDLPDEELAGIQAAYRRFGLIPESLDLRRLMLDVLTEQVVGFYDPKAKALYVVREARPEQAAMIVTHELVHALQDQYVKLDSIQSEKGDNDRSMASAAVLEGQATLVHLAVSLGSNLAVQLPGGWDRVRDLIRQEQASMPTFAAAPRIVQETLIFPYLSGAEFMRTHAERRPNGNIFADMPTSTEQIMHAPAYFDAVDRPTAIALPPLRGRVRYQNSLGEFETRIFLYEHTRDQPRAVRSAAGWDGDRYAVVDTPGGEALVWVTVWDTPVDAAEFTDAVVRALTRRFRDARETELRNGRSFTLGSRTVAVSGSEVAGRNVVVYTDGPSTASALLDPTALRFSESGPAPRAEAAVAP